MHHIQSFILDTLTSAKSLRNKDMRPPKVESNLYQYHLLQLQKDGYIKKQNTHYSLSKRGLEYAAKHSSFLKKERPQPQIITILFVTDDKGNIFIRIKQRQPFIGMHGLVIGKLHVGESADDAVKREYIERVSVYTEGLTYNKFGTAHIVVKQDECTISDYVGIMVEVNSSVGRTYNDNGKFYDINKALNLNLAPGVTNLIEAYVNKSIFTEAILSYPE